MASSAAAAASAKAAAAPLSVVLPGDILGSTSELQPGPGSYADVDAGCVRASRAGRFEPLDLAALHEADAAVAAAGAGVSGADDEGDADEDAAEAAGGAAGGASVAAGDADAVEGTTRALPLAIVEPPAGRSTTAVPAEGDVVMARVRSVGDRQAELVVLVIGETGRALRAPLRGVVRREDIRATDIDRVVMLQSVRPGDVVRAKVLSLGDRRSLFLSTAEPSLGVVWAKSRAGHVMVPAAHDSMRCPVTGEDERRKVARYGF